MPHFIIDCSENVIRLKSADDIMQEVFNSALSTDLFIASEIKVRINPFSYYNNGNSLDDFIHVFGYIMEGRNADEKAKLSKAIVSKLNDILPEVPVISINIMDFEKSNYFNKSMI
ncbi:5-carboxymethyl-2-hydroxymuconate Delta-isomerase [Flavobacterium psychroterrae]|uniref:5-carboxymethyl-2-hydroxymuconate Delta-isomerase n=1 Tax=Flavobacterium psychroterrae TaxID=2133767 RepID=A0ABS5PCQ3_9FLAO|nr:5-carboxymethyl-2-hydroxymuconate Delta-isomerase [Flavobacterium psychroterrae]MBS7232076.1 5-carboxymethyl-2-hydroxymuconate Delta-isomerase [Flavobacterium psychroterrae]